MRSRDIPVLHVKIAGPTLAPEPEQVCRLQRRTTELLADLSARPARAVSVVAEQARIRGWSVEGRAVRLNAYAHASLPSASTTPEQRVRFIADLHALFRLVLGASLPEAAHIALEEVPAVAWGCGGLTQEPRPVSPIQIRVAGTPRREHEGARSCRSSASP